MKPVGGTYLLTVTLEQPNPLHDSASISTRRGLASAQELRGGSSLILYDVEEKGSKDVEIVIEPRAMFVKRGLEVKGEERPW